MSTSKPTSSPTAKQVELDAEGAAWVDVLRRVHIRQQELDAETADLTKRQAELDEILGDATAALQKKLAGADQGLLGAQPVVQGIPVKGRSRFLKDQLFKDHPDLLPLLASYTKVGDPSYKVKLLPAALIDDPP